MKKHNISQLLKSKSFYVVLFVAVIAIAAVTVVGLNLSSEDKKQENLVDLNTPVDVADNEETNVAEGSMEDANKSNAADMDNTGAKEETVVGDYTNDELLEFDVGSFTSEETEQTAKEETQNTEGTAQAENTENTAQANTAEPEQTAQGAETAEPEQSVSVMQPKVTLDSLKFDQECSIAWPVKGNVILPFSVDNLVHYATLGEWKTNPAIIISCEAGVDVNCAVRGIVTEIGQDEEIGTTVTMSIGNGYEIVYGQLAEVDCEVGDVMEEGTVVGKVAEPTKYYSVEGSNLYLQVRKDGTPVNPMLYLAGEE